MTATNPRNMAAIQAAKVVCRKKITDIVENMTLEECLRQSSSIQKKLFSTPEWQKAKRVSVYLSMNKEVRTDEIARSALEDGKTCFVPICRKNQMSMLRIRDISDLDSLPRNSWGIREPKPVEGREDAIGTGGLDFVVVPGVAFTAEGHRLGHGKGYYDRFLRDLKNLAILNQTPPPSAFALAFKEQIISEVPVHDFDIMVDKVITSD